jgi:Na+/melibiose symporter-like transporter
MVTKFGDMLDHIGGILISSILIILIYYKIKNNCNKPIKFLKIFMPLAILILLLVLFFECQEKIYSKNESPSLVSTNLFSIEECKKNINILRYFGPSTLIIYIIIVILFWKKI